MLYTASPRGRAKSITLIGLHPGEPCMLYLGIDLHRKQLTVSIRNEKGGT